MLRSSDRSCKLTGAFVFIFLLAILSCRQHFLNNFIVQKAGASVADTKQELEQANSAKAPVDDLSRWTTPALTESPVAVIIESRQLNTLVPLILHYAAVLGPKWPIVLYTTADHVEYYTNTPSIQRMQHQIEVQALPANTDFNSHDSVSAFLTSPWIWESLAPASHVLLFQTDSMICANAESSMEDFLEYDFIGAPVAAGLGRGYNGGLSLRNRRKMLQIIEQHDWQEERHMGGGGDGFDYKFEDQWFAMRLFNLPDSRLPSEEVAQLFAVETIWAERPLGFHQASRYQQSHMEEVEKWCPEIWLTIGAGFF